MAARAVVTGAAGFAGGHLARTLVARGYSVRALVHHASQISDLQRAGIDVQAGDITDRKTVETLVAGADVVFNVAAVYRRAGIADSVYRAVNTDAAQTIVEAASAAGVRRVVHCSTVGVHGDVEQPPADEDAPLRPGDIYQRTKLAGEQRARATGKRLGIEVVVARPCGIYGPGDRRLLKLFRGVARGRFPMLGSGEIYYHLTYIDDLVDGLVLCGAQPAAAGRAYILAGAEVTTLNTLVAMVADAAGTQPPRIHWPVWPFWIAGALCEIVCAPFGIEPPLYRRRVDFFTKSRSFDISRARQDLGFSPQVTLHEGIRRTLQWYRQHGWL